LRRRQRYAELVEDGEALAHRADVRPEERSVSRESMRVATGGIDGVRERGDPRLVRLQPGVDVRRERRREAGRTKEAGNRLDPRRRRSVELADRGRLQQPGRRRVLDDTVGAEAPRAREAEEAPVCTDGFE